MPSPALGRVSDETMTALSPESFGGPAAGPELSRRALRDIFGCFATGVTIVTAGCTERPVGLTVNSLASVSLDPPLLLFCIDRRAGSLPAFEQAETFAVNVLQAGQQALAARFACQNSERFAEAGWAAGALSLPILDSALAVFECRRHAVHDGGDHRIFVGRVERVRQADRPDPLLVFQGRYRSVESPA